MNVDNRSTLLPKLTVIHKRTTVKGTLQLKTQLNYYS